MVQLYAPVVITSKETYGLIYRIKYQLRKQHQRPTSNISIEYVTGHDHPYKRE